MKQLRKYQQQSDVAYMDGILYSPASGVIMIGRLTNQAPSGRIQRFDRASDPWFYMHAENILRSLAHTSQAFGKPTTHKEYVPVKTYLFRYDRGVFWSGLRAFKYFVTPFNALTRYLLDP